MLAQAMPYTCFTSTSDHQGHRCPGAWNADRRDGHDQGGSPRNVTAPMSARACAGGSGTQSHRRASAMPAPGLRDPARLRLGARWIKCSRFGVTTTLMKCWHCDSEAKAACVFCGRGICATHRKEKDYFLGYGDKHAPALTISSLMHSSATAANVRDASWCGVCLVQFAETY
jgi:hypothetical protein